MRAMDGTAGWSARQGWRALLCLAGLSACGSLGSLDIAGGRERYRDAIRRTGEEQMLLNLVHLQYDDLPSFLQVTTVTSSLNASVNLGVTPTVGATNQATLPLGGSLSENPTITYQPLQGEDFSKTLLSRIPEQSLVALHHGGWNLREIFGITVHDLGGLHNLPPKAPTSGERLSQTDECTRLKSPQRVNQERIEEVDRSRFERVLQLIERLSREHVIDFEVEPVPPWWMKMHAAADSDPATRTDGTKGRSEERPQPTASWPVLRLNRAFLAPDNQGDWDELKNALRLCAGTVDQAGAPACNTDGSHGVYFFSNTHLVDARFDEVDHVTVTMRSLLEAMSALSGGVSIPEGCAHGRQTARCDDPAGDRAHDERSRFRVYCSARPSRQAAVSVWYRGHWFFIRKDDATSRRAFAILLLLFQQGLGKSIATFAPTLTLPIAR